MSDPIYVDRTNMKRRSGEVVKLIDTLDSALRNKPAAADGGAATALIGFIASVGAEAANEYSGAVRLIDAVTDDVLSDSLARDEQIAEELARVEQSLDDDD